LASNQVELSGANDMDEQQQNHVEANKPTRLLTKAQVLELVPVTYPTIWSWMRLGKFPRSREMSPDRVVWFEEEILAWKKSMPVRRLLGEAGAVERKVRNPNGNRRRGAKKKSRRGVK
jgi:prophage regulatory protein